MKLTKILLVLVSLQIAYLWFTREREWVQQGPIDTPVGQESPGHLIVRVTDGPNKDHIGVDLQLEIGATPEGQDIALTIQCGSERVLVDGLELLPVRGEQHPSWVYPNGCTDSNKLLNQPGSVWMFFPRPKSIGRHLLFQLPRISCAGKDCSRLVIPATLEFQSEPLKNRDFTLHG